MKLVKSLLLGSAAGIVVASGAMAADLPARKAAPAEYVRVCSAYGAGFFYIPGTETCMKIGGLVRYQYEYNQSYSRTSAATGTRAQFNLDVDVRNATAYGTLRAFARLSVARRTGTALSGTQQRWGQAEIATDATWGNQGGIVGNAQTVVALDKAFIQFGGLTAGRAASFFDFYADALQFNGAVSSNIGSTNLLAYTAVFGGGFSATLSIEDPIERRAGVLSADAAMTNFRYAAPSAPDVVAALRVDQSWGSAQISGAVHQVNALHTTYPAAAPVAYNGSKWGWAVQGGLKLNLPMLAPGDALWLQAAYSQGATSYGGMTNLIAGGTPMSSVAGAMNTALADAFVDPVTGRIGLTKSWSIAGAFVHYWTPSVRQAIFGSYGRVDLPATANNLGILAGAARGRNLDYSVWRVGTNLYWSPVPNFDIGGEIAYTKASYKGGIGANLDGANVANGLRSSVGQWHGMLRIQRGF